MNLIVGLGNYEDSYLKNRHNVGFLAIDYLLKNTNHTQINKKDFFGQLFKKDNNLYLKPHTFMNLSGKSISAVASFYKIPSCNICVIYDDLDLKLGALKFKIGGSNAGHNGIKSIDSTISHEYKKIKVGIGRPEFKSQVHSYVLSDFSDEQLDIINTVFKNVENSINDIDNISFTQIASKYSLRGTHENK